MPEASQNPYESSALDPKLHHDDVVNRPGGKGTPRHFQFLSIFLCTTLVLATKNAVEEDLDLAFAIQVVLASGVSQLFGLGVSVWNWRNTSRWRRVLLVPAYAVALTGLLVFAMYAFNGKADSMNSAAHMHVIVFPVLHCMLAAVLYTMGLIYLGIVAMALRSR